MTLEIAIGMFLVTKQCQLDLNYERKEGTGTIDYLITKLLIAVGIALPPTPSFFKEMKTTGFYLKI